MKIAIRPIEPVAVITTTWRMVEPCVNFERVPGTQMSWAQMSWARDISLSGWRSCVP